VRALPAAGALPPPWESWALIGLVRHRQRQLWVGEVVTTRRDRAQWLRYEMEKLHDRVLRVRDRVPPEPPAGRRW
jgi:hypothetical protein